MNDLSHDTIGIFRRELRDTRTIVANADHKLRQVLDGGPRAARPGVVARYAACSVISRVSKQPIDAVAKQHFPGDRDLASLITLKTASPPAMTTVPAWAGDLVTAVVQDIASNLLGDTALAQLRAIGLAYVFTPGGVVKVPVHTLMPSGAFVGENLAVPVAAMILSSLTLKPRKAAAITTFTKELAKGSPLNIETSLRALLADDLGLMIDQILLGTAAATTSAPAGLFAGVAPIAGTAGGGVNALLGDVRALLNAISPAIKPCLVTNSTQAASLAIIAPTSAVPVIVAPFMTADSVAAIDVAAFASSLGVPDFQTNEDAAITEETAPAPISEPGTPNTVAAPARSLWQTASIGIRTLIDCDWTLRRANAVAVINGTSW